ncbi:MAG TPA: DUF3500 domain-containing protein [Gammaproteobacteria bacterium]
MNRRLLIKGAVGAGLVAGAGALGRYALLAPSPTGRRASMDELVAELLAALSPSAKAQACFSYDHPLRQYHNRGLWLGGLSVNAVTLDWDTRRLLTDVMHAGLSEAGRNRVPLQDSTSFFGVNMLQLAICGDPSTGPYQLVLSGVHLNLRLGSASPEGTAFGGPQVYGDQRGNGRVGLPSNTYRYQLEAAQRLVAALTPAERAQARVARAPAQVNIGVQGAAGRFDGVAIADLAPAKRALAREVVAGILGTYADESAAYAWQCLDRNGGIDGLHFADYDEDFEGGRLAGDGPSQIFRIEGPAAVFHFRGEPHLHAFINVTMDGEKPLGVGEALGHNPTVLEGESLRALFETAMRTQAQADVGYYPLPGVVGRLRAGEVRAGDLWVAESWVNELVVVEVQGNDVAPELAAVMRSRGVVPQAHTRYRIATTDYSARDESFRLGRVGPARTLGPLREALVAHVRSHGFGREV